MATYSTNTTIKINSKINITLGSLSLSYTVPANCYAEIWVSPIGGGTYSINIDGSRIFSSASGFVLPKNSSSPTDQNLSGKMKLGPGAVLSIGGSGLSGSELNVRGILFENTP